MEAIQDSKCEFEHNVSINVDDSSSNSDINLSDVGVVGFNSETKFASRDVNFSAVGQEIIVSTETPKTAVKKENHRGYLHQTS